MRYIAQFPLYLLGVTSNIRDSGMSKAAMPKSLTEPNHNDRPAENSRNFLNDLLPVVRQRLRENGIVSEMSSETTLRVVWQKRQLFSTLACLAVSEDKKERRVVLKRIVHTPSNRGLGDVWDKPRAHIEYEILDRLHAGFRNVHSCGVPRPLLLLPEFDALVMDYCPGPMLADLFRGAKHFVSRSGFQTLHRYVSRAGTWSRRFHALTDPAKGGKESVEDIVHFCQRMLREIASSDNPMIPKDLGERVFTRIIHLREAIPVDSVPVARKHDDYGPWNMIASPDKLVVIDFAAEKRGPCCSDVLKMLVFMEDLKQNPLFSSRKLRLLQKSLRSAYGSRNAFPDEALAICEAKHRISSLWHCVRSSPRTIWHQYVRGKMLASHIFWLTRIGNVPSLWEKD